MPPQARARAIGYLPQSPEIAWDVSVETLVALGRLPWPGAAAAQTAIDAAIAAMDLDALRHRPVSRLSGGERARALMARVLARQPALAARRRAAGQSRSRPRRRAGRLPARSRRSRGRGVVLVLHDLAQAMNHADRVLVLAEGALVADGPPGEALCEAVIARVWGVAARWLGEAGSMALALPG